LYFVIIFWV